ncbi:MAG: hypothetical protein KatS3mg035_0627 [Bacteroidia bacterium]|nr:MAG: hypothetical protein KatS3mg035_0627 [Bacteroidia bacterium]
MKKNGKPKDIDFWLLSVHEIDCDLVKPMFTMDIKNNFEKMDVPIRFQNQSNYGGTFFMGFWRWFFFNRKKSY